MSWSVTTGKVPADTVESAVDALEVPPTNFTVGAVEWEAQLTAAKSAAKALVASGALGDSGAFTVSLTGHANPGHELRDEHSSELITVNVYRTLA